MDQQFIELFDVSKIEVNPDHLPSWPEIQDSWRLWARSHHTRIASPQIVDNQGDGVIADSRRDGAGAKSEQEALCEPKSRNDVKSYPTVDQRVP